MATASSRPQLAPSAPSYATSPSPGPSGRLQPGTKVQVGKYVVRVDKFLSEGGFAHVYVASLVSPSSVEGFAPTQNTFVLKRMAVPDKAGLVEVRKEVDVMKQLRPHKHIVYFIEASASSLAGTSGYEIFILMEYCPGGGIIDLLNSRLQNRLTESEILKIFSDTVDAVAHMHSQKPILMHRDLKVENILVAAPNLYKLCDFGSTTTPSPTPLQSTAEIQALEADLNKHTTLQYRSPEMVDVWNRKGVTEKADIWALGVFLYKLCYYTTPFEEHGPLAIINVQYTIPPYPAYSNSIKYLIGTMLQESAQSRPNVWAVHEHTCRLRGIQPYLIRPVDKPGSSPNKPISPLDPKSTTTQASSHAPKPDGLDSIFTTAPQRPPANKLETVVPMRRGRPAVKPKDIMSQTVVQTEGVETDASKISGSLVWNVPKPTARVDVPEESDLFAREAAAGFGDSFTIVSPHTRSGLSGTTLSSPPLASSPSQTLSATPARDVNLKTASMANTPARNTSHAFEDLVPPTKKAEPQSMNTIRNSQPDPKVIKSSPQSFSRPAKRDSFTGPSSRPFHHAEHVNQSVKATANRPYSLSQKTGPQFHGSRGNQNIYAGQANATQTTGPTYTTASKPVIQVAQARKISEWLEKDQGQLVSRSVQTSPRLLSGLINELMSELPTKMTGDLLQTDVKTRDGKPASVNLLADDEEDIAASAKLGFGTKSYPDGPKPFLTHSTSTSDVLQTQERFRPINKVKPGDLNGAVPETSLPTRSLVNRYTGPRASPVPTPKSNVEASLSSDSEDEPEEAEGLARFVGRPEPSLSTTIQAQAFGSKKTNALPASIQKRHSQPYTLKTGGTFSQIRSRHDVAPPAPAVVSNASSSRASSSDMTTEDEDTKARRRASIAKFAPPATSRPIVEERDPFSSRAQTRSRSPDNQSRLSSMLTGSRSHRALGPPLCAPKPQSLKSAAAITSLVSRYESLSVTETSTSTMTTATTASSQFGSKKVSGSTKLGFKPTARHSPVISPPSNKPMKKSHIPRTSLGPGANSLRSSGVKEEEEEDEEEDEEAFNGVNDLKSKWETGAVKRAEAKAHGPRTDYGQIH